jgi:hypothetical protein
MTGIISGIVSFGLMITVMVLWVFPFTFTTVSGLFEKGAFGTVVGLLTAALVGYIAIQVAILLALAIGVIVAVFVER